MGLHFADKETEAQSKCVWGALAQVTLLESRPLIAESSRFWKTEERVLHWACSVVLVLRHPTVVLRGGLPNHP